MGEACHTAPKLSASSEGNLQEIFQSLPEGIEIRKAPYGHGLYATKFFPKGSTLYIGTQLVIPSEYAEFKLVLNDLTFLLNTETHAVQFSESSRWLYLFDSFMNHSCDPTTISEQSSEQKALNEEYQTIALKDIHPGDEITSDYNLFEYDCRDKGIEQCLCGSPDCIGRIAGFRYLSTQEQQRRISLVEHEVLMEMNNDPENKFHYITDLKFPIDRVVLELVGKESFKLLAAKPFTKGEIVYHNESLMFSKDASIVLQLGKSRKWLDNLVYTVNRGNDQREFYYFDSFQNHSCDPNTEMRYHADNVYDLIATRNVAIGEELTSDYESFDIGLDGTSFTCECGSAICRGIVKA